MDTIKVKKERKPRKPKEPVLEKDNVNLKELQNNDLTAKIEQLMNVNNEVKDVPLEPPKLKREESNIDYRLKPKSRSKIIKEDGVIREYYNDPISGPMCTIQLDKNNTSVDTSKIYTDDDVINIGKFKNQNFKVLKNPENHTYCVWLARQKRPDYQPLAEYCRNYVKQNPLNVVPVQP